MQCSKNADKTERQNNSRSLQKSQFKYKSNFGIEKYREKVQAKMKTASLVQEYGRIISPTTNYKIIEFTGQGSYGQVVKCLKEDNNETVALKILNGIKTTPKDCENERKILFHLNVENADKFHVVRTLDFFIYKNQPIFVFEMLGKSLQQYLQDMKYRPIPLNGISSVAKQILTALSKLKELRIIHADMKPDNIMFLDSSQQSWHIKIIDFGLAVQLPTDDYPNWRQTRFYRAPEVLLGLPHSESIDMWSLGCILAELFLGAPLYPGCSNYDQVRYICQTQGIPPQHMLENGVNAKHFFCQEKDISQSQDCRNKWRLKTSEEYKSQTAVEARETRTFVLESLDDIIKVTSRSKSNDDAKISREIAKRARGVDLLKRMLELDGDKRISPEDALKHKFLQPLNVLKNS